MERSIRRQTADPDMTARRSASDILAELDWAVPLEARPAGPSRYRAILEEDCAHCLNPLDVPAAAGIGRRLPERNAANMNEDQEIAHTEHLRQAQDHFRWRREHMEALAILKRTEAAIYLHEARIVAHDAEIARHEEQIAHGASHSDTPPSREHADFAEAHRDTAEHHSVLLDAIRGLEPYIDAVRAR